MNNPDIFLDIDGVLNDHEVANHYCYIKDEYVELFNIFLHAFDSPNIILTSAWRYMIINGAMTFKGFQYLLYSHGINGSLLKGYTEPDEMIPTREAQILNYVNNFKLKNYVVIDDLPLQLDRFVKVEKGLKEEDIIKAGEILCPSVPPRLKKLLMENQPKKLGFL